MHREHTQRVVYSENGLLMLRWEIVYIADMQVLGGTLRSMWGRYFGLHVRHQHHLEGYKGKGEIWLAVLGASLHLANNFFTLVGFPPYARCFFVCVVFWWDF